MEAVAVHVFAKKCWGHDCKGSGAPRVTNADVAKYKAEGGDLSKEAHEEKMAKLNAQIAAIRAARKGVRSATLKLKSQTLSAEDTDEFVHKCWGHDCRDVDKNAAAWEQDKSWAAEKRKTAKGTLSPETKAHYSERGVKPHADAGKVFTTSQVGKNMTVGVDATGTEHAFSGSDRGARAKAFADMKLPVFGGEIAKPISSYNQTKDKKYVSPAGNPVMMVDMNLGGWNGPGAVEYSGKFKSSKLESSVFNYENPIGGRPNMYAAQKIRELADGGDKEAIDYVRVKKIK